MRVKSIRLLFSINFNIKIIKKKLINTYECKISFDNKFDRINAPFERFEHLRLSFNNFVIVSNIYKYIRFLLNFNFIIMIKIHIEFLHPLHS